MLPKHPRRNLRSIIALLLLIMGVSLLSAIPTGAQSVTPIEYGAVVTGNLADPDVPVLYSFTGTAGDLVAIRVIGTSSGMDPNVILVGPMQETLAMNENAFFDPPTTSANLVFRLLASATYTIAVGGTPGDFLLTFDAQPAPAFTLLDIDTPIELSFPLPENVQLFTFNTDPFAVTTLHIDANPLDLEAFVGIRDATGQPVAALQGNLDNACVSLGPGDELQEIRIVGSPDRVGTITLTLGRGPCELGQAPEPVAQPTLQFEPIAIEGVCTSTSIHNINIRNGPGLQFPVIVLWLARQPLEVIGRTEDGLWYAVQTAGVQGWIAAPLVVLTGPCEELPVMEAPQPPQASPTPGLPAATPTPMATATATTPPTQAATETAPPSATVAATQTPDVTVEMTATVLPATATVSDATATTVPTASPTEAPPEETEVPG